MLKITRIIHIHDRVDTESGRKGERINCRWKRGGGVKENET
jgi:hypothetical protein